MELLDGVDLLSYLWRREVAVPGEPTPTTLTSMLRGVDDADDEDHTTLNSPPPTPCDIDRLRHAMSQLTRGLHALHSAGKIHGDVKPPNIHVTSDGRVVLLDFGLDAERQRRPGAGDMVVGTVGYMAPEQCTGDVRVSAAADWYCVGVVLFHALTGRLPFEGAVARVLFDKQTEAAPRPSTLVRHVPRDLDDLCAELLEREPANRPTGEQLLRRLGLG
jgi:serine/threonine protein kinase